MGHLRFKPILSLSCSSSRMAKKGKRQRTQMREVIRDLLRQRWQKVTVMKVVMEVVGMPVVMMTSNPSLKEALKMKMMSAKARKARMQMENGSLTTRTGKVAMKRRAKMAKTP